MVRILLIDFIGACAGLIAISVGAHFQLVSHHVHSGAYTIALYVMGTLLLLINLEQIIVSSRAWHFIRLLLYLAAIWISVSAWRDLEGKGSTLIHYLKNCKLCKLCTRDP